MFEVGDVLECIDAKPNSEIENGKLYTVKKVDTHDRTVSFNGYAWFYMRRFRLANNDSPYKKWEHLAMGIKM